MAVLSTGYRPLASCPAQRAGAQRLCALALTCRARKATHGPVIGGNADSSEHPTQMISMSGRAGRGAIEVSGACPDDAGRVVDKGNRGDLRCLPLSGRWRRLLGSVFAQVLVFVRWRAAGSS